MAAPAQVVAMPQTMPVFGILDDHDDEDLAIITDYLLEGGDLGVDDWTGGGAEALPSSSSSSSGGGGAGRAPGDDGGDVRRPPRR